MEPKVDASEHLGLIYRVVNQMGLRGDYAEEAISEGLVAITKAAQSFDPSREVPLASWLAKNLRWEIASWVRKQRATVPLLPTMGLQTPRDVLSAHSNLTQVLIAAQKILTAKERKILLAVGMGYSSREISIALNLSESAINLIKFRARKKLREEIDGRRKS